MLKRSESAALWIPANERFKAQHGDWMAVGVIAAVLAHGALFTLFPEMNAEDVRFTSDATAVITPPEVTIPPPPDPDLAAGDAAHPGHRHRRRRHDRADRLRVEPGGEPAASARRRSAVGRARLHQA